MMRPLFALILIIFLNTISFAQIDYPVTYKKPVIDNYHGNEVVDEYRWLEFQENDSVNQWIKSQNKIAKKYLNKLVSKYNSDEKMNKYMFSELGSYEGELKVKNNDEFYFRYFVSGSSSTPSLFYKKGINSEYRILVNSQSLSRKDKIDIGYYKVSKNDTWLAYQYNRNGSDWHEIRVVKIDKKRHYFNILKHTRKTGIYWWNDGFFYKKFPFDSINAVYKKPTIMYHKVGTKQDEDKLMFKSYSDDENISILGTKNENFYIIKRENTKTEIFNYYLFNPQYNTDDVGFKPFLINVKYDLSFHKATDSLIYASTVINSKKHLLTIRKDDPTKFKLITPNYKTHNLQDFEMMEDYVVASYHSPNNSILVKVDYNGNVLNESVLPNGLSVTDIGYNDNYKEFFFYLSSYTIPRVLYKLNLDSFEYELVGETEVNFDFKNYKFKQDFYESHDGVKVPICIVYKDSLKKDKSTPFLLRTYGGYGSVNIPQYNPGIVYFIENGGAFAYADIRGSGGFGSKWVTDGKRLNKNNGIKDFIYAAKFLIKEGYSAPRKIAISGSSHGGLIVGAAITQAPDLFGSAVIYAGALDMLRFGKFTVGSTLTNIKEFGSTKYVDDFINLKSYSPYHNVDESINYPSTLIVAGDYDNRVPPLHSYKFTAKLQNRKSQKNPILLWTQDRAGHFGANTRKETKQENTYIYSFLLHQLESD